MTQFTYFIPCFHCQEPIVLPHESPLGIYGIPTYKRLDIWPVSFICGACERVSELRADDKIHQAFYEANDPRLQGPILWRVNFSCRIDGAEKHFSIYANGSVNNAARMLGRTTFCEKALRPPDITEVRKWEFQPLSEASLYPAINPT
jgi:hypothetical protein